MAQTLEHNKVVTQVVPITVPSCDVDVTVIQQLDDEPNDVGGLTAAELKAKFDETNAAVKSYINDELIPAVVGADATEQARAAAEAERVANEIERVSNETTRVNAETTRGNNETARQSAEITRGNNETTRVSNETTRQNNEAARQNNEAARVLAEAARENAETGYVAQCATSAQDAEAWAVGKRGGVNVGESDPAYHNNALYWKEQAQQAAGGGVTSFNGRAGTVVPQEGDYTAGMVGAIPVNEKGAANGVASLGSDGKVPGTQLPSLDYIPTSQKGSANGVASLGADGKVPSAQLPEIGGEAYTATLLSSGWVADGNYQKQTVTVTGLKASYPVAPVVDAQLSGTDADGDAAILTAFAAVNILQTAANQLIAYCIGSAPDTNIPLIINTWG